MPMFWILFPALFGTAIGLKAMYDERQAQDRAIRAVAVCAVLAGGAYWISRR